MNPAEFAGRDSFSEFSAFFGTLGARSIFLVTGKKSWALSGAEERITPLLEGRRVTKFDDFSSNPQLEDVARGTSLFQRDNPELVVAVGGGSVLDTAKCIALLGRQDSAPAECVTGAAPVKNPATPLVAVPTTAGTGSEATRFATVYIKETKYSLQHDSILPVAYVADPVFTTNLSPYLTAVTGIDALAQAIESYWSVKSTHRSREYAARAVSLAVTSLEKAVVEPDYEARLAMMTASNLAGKAINVSKTTACHALSYYLTARFGVPHGHAVGLFLAPVLEYNNGVTTSDINDNRGVSHVRKMIQELTELIGANHVEDAARTIESLLTRIGLSDLKAGPEIDPIHVQNMVHDALDSNRMVNNPRSFDRESLPALLTSVFQ
jgi:alcohol dehydrogenase class IV